MKNNIVSLTNHYTFSARHFAFSKERKKERKKKKKKNINEAPKQNFS